MLQTNKQRENGDPNGAHAFDTGAAWGYLAIQATLLGLVTHAIGGFDREEVRRLLNIPQNFDLHAVIAIGYQGEKEILDENLQKRENPNTRKPLKELVFEGKVSS